MYVYCCIGLVHNLNQPLLVRPVKNACINSSGCQTKLNGGVLIVMYQFSSIQLSLTTHHPIPLYFA